MRFDLSWLGTTGGEIRHTLHQPQARAIILRVILPVVFLSALGYFVISHGIQTTPPAPAQPTTAMQSQANPAVVNGDARVVRVIDGDTVEIEHVLLTEAQTGFTLTLRATARLYGINAPDKKDGIAKRDAAKDYLITLLKTHDNQVYVTFHGRDKYGRLLATFALPAIGTSVNDCLVKTGHAVPYLPLESEEYDD
jgi:endonuclease YncB( thermonuclease family)